MPKEIQTTVTFLEMTEDPHLSPAHPPDIGRFALMKVTNIPIPFYRFLFDEVGGDYDWISRKLVSDEELAEIVHHDDVEIFVLYRDGAPAGYFELNFKKMPDVEISFIGLTKSNLGNGLGGFLLNAAIRRAWERGPSRVHLQTCTLDHPRALVTYQKFGFVPCGQMEETLVLPD